MADNESERRNPGEVVAFFMRELGAPRVWHGLNGDLRTRRRRRLHGVGPQVRAEAQPNLRHAGEKQS